MAFLALIQLFQASSQPIQAPNWLSGFTSAHLDLNSAQTDGRMDERTDERKSPCVLQDFVPFEAAALLPLTPIHNQVRQGNEYRWPHIALGRPVTISSPHSNLGASGTANHRFCDYLVMYEALFIS